MVTKDMIINRLGHFGYTVSSEDDDIVDFELQKTIDYVHNYCNITTIPTILEYRIIDRVCSYILFNMKNAGKLENCNYDAVIKQIKEGDTTIQYATGQDGDTPESRFDSFVKQLERGFDKWLTPHRRLRW
jgi:hypothetical protein